MAAAPCSATLPSGCLVERMYDVSEPQTATFVHLAYVHRYRTGIYRRSRPAGSIAHSTL